MFLSKCLKHDLRADYPSAEDSGDGGDKYAGLDRFGRIVDQRWIKSNGTSLDRYKYTYDQDSNVTSKINTNATSFNETYTYNGMSQLITVDRSNGTADDQSWSLDALGNMNSVTTGATTVTRTHNSDNQITAIGAASGLTYDDNGNMTTDDQGRKFTWDAWNRLVLVTDSAGVIIKFYAYDGMGRRTNETDGYTTKDFYYNTSWQLVEEKSGSTVNANYLWSPVYVDALMFRSSAANGSYYATSDANFNVTGIYASSGNITERFVYSAYGKRTDLTSGWTASADSKKLIVGWQGSLRDDVTDLIILRNRWYSYTLRWLSGEPGGGMYVDGMDLYVPMADNPINRVDWTGLAGVASITVNNVGYSLPPVGDHETFISVAQARALGIPVAPGRSVDIPLGPHVHGDNGTKYFPRYNIELDIKTKTYSQKTPKFSAKFIEQCDNNLSPKQKAKIGVMALALGAILINEASGANAQNVHDLERNLNTYNNAITNGDNMTAHITAPLIAQNIQSLFGNDIVAQWSLGQLEKNADK